MVEIQLDRQLEYCEEFYLYLINNNYSLNTVENYKRDLYIFEVFLHSHNMKFLELSKLDVNKYKGYLRTGQHLIDIDELGNSKDLDAENTHGEVQYKKSSSKGSKNGRSKVGGLNSRSVNRMLSTLRSYLAFLIDIDKESPLSPSAIKLVKTEKTEKQVADFDELVSLIESPEIFETKKLVRYRNRAILELLFSTGMRISELINLDKEHLRMQSGSSKIIDDKLYIMGKGKKQRYVYLTERAIMYTERYLVERNDQYPALFIPYKGMRRASENVDMVRISSRYVQNIIQKYKKKLGILIPTTPHSLRHGFATYLAEKGANPAAIQKLLGHESLQTTTRYVHASDRFAEKSHREHHPLQVNEEIGENSKK
jgi:site-specific recombinase XerD